MAAKNETQATRIFYELENVMSDYKAFEEDSIALDKAKEAAERLSFYPMMFQAAMSLRRLGILEKLQALGKKGISSEELSTELGISQYGIETLLEAGLSLELVKLVEPYKYRIAKTGSFWLRDKQTVANADFVQDICYEGTHKMDLAIKEEKPAGLSVLGDWPTIYHGLSKLPKQEKESWFNFDHHYSDQAFPEAAKAVFEYEPKTMLDIGGNTGKWSFLCVEENPEVHMTIVDLPGQCGLANDRIAAAGLTDRISTHEQNVLDDSYQLPAPTDSVWMSQFLDCFSPDQIVHILTHAESALSDNGRVFILETFWDLQENITATYCLHATSLYFTTMANGNSKMYDSKRMEQYVEEAGLEVEKIVDTVGYYHSLMVCKKKEK
ncbi:MAG: ubiquinone/menaquinone biosynthesis C-methylase UbiE [Granulosicoccus sp.]